MIDSSTIEGPLPNVTILVTPLAYLTARNWLDTSNFAKRYLGNKGDVVGPHFPRCAFRSLSIGRKTSTPWRSRLTQAMASQCVLVFTAYQEFIFTSPLS